MKNLSAQDISPKWRTNQRERELTELNLSTISASDIATLQAKAHKGDVIAQAKLGDCYFYGNGVPQDHDEAAKWFWKAAEGGSALGQFFVGQSYAQGSGVPKNEGQSVKWYRKAAEQGYVRAQFNLGVCYDEGSGVPQDFVEAAKWYRRAADQDFAPAQFNLGKLYENGIGVDQDLAEALGWFRKAASQDFAPAKNALARLLANGRGTENFGRLLAAALARLFYCLFAVFVIAIVQGFHFGFRQRDYLVLALGAFVSFLGAFAYGSVGVARANGREKKPWMFFAICSGWLPYMFLMYLIFYRGIWALIRLFSAFSWSSLFAAFVFIALGLFAIRYLQTITDAVRNIPETKK